MCPFHLWTAILPVCPVGSLVPRMVLGEGHETFPLTGEVSQHAALRIWGSWPLSLTPCLAMDSLEHISLPDVVGPKDMASAEFQTCWIHTGESLKTEWNEPLFHVLPVVSGILL